MDRLDCRGPRSERLPGRPGPEHESRVAFLESLAVLLGCTQSFGFALPDGRCPDVVRFSIAGRRLFLGDAKHTESPGCTETQVRIQSYLRWVSAHVRRDGRTGIFALCFGRRADSEGWVRVVEELGREAGVDVSTERGVEQFAPDLWVAWFLAQPASQETSPVRTSGEQGRCRNVDSMRGTRAYHGRSR